MSSPKPSYRPSPIPQVAFQMVRGLENPNLKLMEVLSLVLGDDRNEMDQH